jgi:hypothetical protein
MKELSKIIIGWAFIGLDALEAGFLEQAVRRR